MSAIVKAERTLLEKAIFGLSVLLFFLFGLVPGLTGSYAYGDCGGGGGGGGCPGSCVARAGSECCRVSTTVCRQEPDGTVICSTVSNTYNYP